MNNITAMLEDIAKVDNPSKMANRRMILVLMPAK
jgi:translation initiation factor IF-3